MASEQEGGAHVAIYDHRIDHRRVVRSGGLWKHGQSGTARSPLVPVNRRADDRDLKVGVLLESPWNDVYVYDVRLQSYTEMVDALSSDDLLVKLKAAIIMRPIAEEVYFLAQEIGPDFIPGLSDRSCWPRCAASCRTIRWSRFLK